MSELDLERIKARDVVTGPFPSDAQMTGALGFAFRDRRALIDEVERLRKALETVRQRVVVDFYTDTTGREDAHWWACRVCGYTWRQGDQEVHDETCPLRALPKKE